MRCNRCNVRVGELGRYRLAALHFGYRAKQLTAMTKRHPDFFEVLVCQIRQDGETDVILGKPLSVLPKAELLKPIRNLLHQRPPTDFALSVLDRQDGKSTTRANLLCHRQAVNVALRGRIILISVYSPGCVSTSIDPECCFTMMSWVMDRPRPVPSPAGLVVKKGLNIFSLTSGGMPGPLSRILISTLSSRFF